MNNNASFSIVLSLAVALIAGCANPRTGSTAIQGDDALSNISHTVAPGDRLSDIALKYTGQIDLWEAIATYNQITDPLKLRIGDTLTIPASMIPAQERTAKDPVATNSDRNTSSAVAAAKTGSLALQRTREAQQTPGEVDAVLIAPVKTNRTFDLNPIEASGLSASRDSNSSPPRIRVIGSYYPKGVYQQPAGYSKLLMRVAPGTIFELEREINDWYKVVTDQGVGYIRRVDGTLISN